MPRDRFRKSPILAVPMTNPKLLVETIITAVGILEDKWEDYSELITNELLELHNILYQELNARLVKFRIVLSNTYNGALIGSMAITRTISQAIESVSSQINRAGHLVELIAKPEFCQLLNSKLDELAASLYDRYNEMGIGFTQALKAQPVSVRVW